MALNFIKTKSLQYCRINLKVAKYVLKVRMYFK